MRRSPNNRLAPIAQPTPSTFTAMDPQLLTYYEAIEKASADMLSAARDGNWDEVVKLEGACVLLISQLKNASLDDAEPSLAAQKQAAVDADAAKEAARKKTRIMQRILVNDAEIRHLAEPWLQDLSETLAGRGRTLH